MNQHVEEGRLQAWLDGELLGEEDASVAAHLEGCPVCRDAVRELEALGAAASAAISLLEVPAPDLDAALWEVRRRGARSRSAGHRERLAAAAVVVLLLGAGAAVAMPGSPLRNWLEAPAGPEVASFPVGETPEAPSSALGVTVDLLDGSITVAFHQVPEAMVLELEPVEEGRAGVYAPAASRFRTAPGRVEVTVSGPGDVLRVRIPATTHRAEIRVDDRVVARVVDGDLLLPGAAGRSALDARIRVSLPRDGPSPDQR
jgi:predicted anti-sigma-YlaC factor YlaD